VTLTNLAVVAGGGNGVSVNNANATVLIQDSTISGSNQGVRINDSNTVTLDNTQVTGNAIGLVRDGGASSGNDQRPERLDDQLEHGARH
jgi:hypothetical protein